MKWFGLYQIGSGDFEGVGAGRRKSRRECTTESTEYTEMGSTPRGRGRPRSYMIFRLGNGRGIGYAGIVVGVGVGGIGGFGCGGGGLGSGLVEDDGFVDDFGPAVVEGFEEFLFGEALGLEHELAELGESDGGLGLD